MSEEKTTELSTEVKPQNELDKKIAESWEQAKQVYAGLLQEAEIEKVLTNRHNFQFRKNKEWVSWTDADGFGMSTPVNFYYKLNKNG